VLNPWNIWFIVVLIVGIGLGGYAVYTLAGARLGPLIGGAVGGLISSTATTVSYARRAAAQPEQSPACACVIAVASSVVFVRIGAIVAAAAPALLPALWGPLAIVGGAAGLGALLLVRATQRNGDGAPRLGNPAELGPALAFAAIYTVVLIAVRFVREQFGETGVYGVAAIAGLTDVDAIVLSTARLSLEGQLAADLAWRAIVLSTLANLVFKAAVVIVLGPAELRRWVAAAFAPPLLAGAAILLLWPGP
jgi:uncharacterized membrane protein (DUF4010 family)